MSNQTITCGTQTPIPSTTPFVDLGKMVDQPFTYPTTGVEEYCSDTYKKLYDMSLKKIDQLEKDIQTVKLDHHHDHLSMVRKLAEEYEARLSAERLRYFNLQEELEKLTFKYRKLLLDYEKIKVVLKTSLK